MKIFFKLIIQSVLLLFLFGLSLTFFWVFVQQNANSKIKELQLSFFEATPVDIKVPVRYIDKDELITRGAALETKDKKRFRFRIDRKDPNRFWITKFDAFCGNRLGARYQITDPEIEKQLVELFKKYELEEKLRFEQEENKTRMKNAPDSTKTPER